MAMLRNKYSQLLAAGLRSIFIEFQKLQAKESMMEQLFNVQTSDKAYEDDMIFAGLSAMPEKVENDSFLYQELVQGGTKRYIHLTYGMGSRYSWELAEDDQYGIVKQVPKALVRGGNFTKEMVPWNVLNLGFTTITTADGVSLFNNQHPLLGGVGATAVGPGVSNVISAAGTYPNRPATDMDLSVTALQLAKIHADRMIDSMGIPVQYAFNDLWIPPELQFVADEILGSDGKPYTSDNEKNPVKGLFKVHVVPYLTSASAWFLSAPKDVHSLNFFNRSPLSQAFDDDFDTDAVKHKAKQRFSCGATNWIGVWGSNGP